MYSITICDNPTDFRDLVYPTLLQSEAEYCLGIGLIDTLIGKPDRYAAFHLGAVKSADQKTVVGAVWQTPPFPLGVTRLPEPSVAAVVDFALSLPEYPLGIVGPADTVDKFNELWTKATGASIKLVMKQGIYALSKVEVDPRSFGKMRVAGEDDRQLLEHWSHRFSVDCGLGDDPLKAKEYADVAIKFKNRYFWEVDGVPVSMAGVSGDTPNGIRVNWVYTPPELRGKSYASDLVAKLSQAQLDSGKKLCFLYTDLANQGSNSIYQRIGYKKVSESVQYSFAY